MSDTKDSLMDELFATEDFSEWRVGLSWAASHAWGPSIAATLGILLVIGWEAAIFWAIGNVFFAPVYMALYQRFPELKLSYRLRGILALLLVIQFFALWNNQQLIFEIGYGQADVEIYSLMSAGAAQMLAIGIALFAAVFIYKYGLPGSMTTDIYQYAAMLGGVWLIILLSVFVYGNTPTISHFASTGGMGTFPRSFSAFIFNEGTGIWWGILGGISYIGHPYVDTQQWQRIERSPTIKTGLWFSLFFGAYLASVFLMATVLGVEIMLLAAILLIAALGVATSTIDSACAALQRLTGNAKLAFVFAVAAIVSWPIVTSLGVVAIWGIYAMGRLVMFLIVFGAILGARAGKIDLSALIGTEDDWDPDTEEGIFGRVDDAQRID